ncbi:MAG: S-methyl-5-thioribose-1-phosphate isomerase [Candidatus Omnitrophica bacterium]|nr:S-methyl-5-thioribose-1-phosphate isomerase [Candidatus Omnitrophota bacterium]
MKESILFWPVRLEGDTLYILDETKIPGKVAYLKVRDYLQAIDAVVSMKTRAFGQFLTVCYAFILETQKSRDRTKEELMGILKKVAEAFNNSRPTFPFAEVTGMVLGIAQKVYGSPAFPGNFIRAMEGMLKGIRQQRHDRASRAAGLLKDGDSVLTHCHVSGEMSLIGEFCRRDAKKVKFFATETRPYFQGARLTAWELKRDGFDVTLIPDNAVAKVMAEGNINCVIVGSDRSAKNGDFANKIGTYQIALLAKHFGIPFYVLVQPSDKLKSGADIPIEIRDDDEILAYDGKRLAPKGCAAYYPGFDVVSNELVTKHIAINAN